MPPWIADEHHGNRDGIIGLPVPSGKVADRDGVLLRTALRELAADGTVTHLRVTPRQDVLARDVNPWRPCYDKVFAAVVRAESEARARELVQAEAGHEGLGIYRALGMDEEETALTVWLDEAYARCLPLAAQGRPGVLVVDRREG